MTITERLLMLNGPIMATAWIVSLTLNHQAQDYRGLVIPLICIGIISLITYSKGIMQ